jgi:hypothetical protein
MWRRPPRGRRRDGTGPRRRCRRAPRARAWRGRRAPAAALRRVPTPGCSGAHPPGARCERSCEVPVGPRVSSVRFLDSSVLEAELAAAAGRGAARAAAVGRMRVVGAARGARGRSARGRGARRGAGVRPAAPASGVPAVPASGVPAVAAGTAAPASAACGEPRARGSCSGSPLSGHIRGLTAVGARTLRQRVPGSTAARSQSGLRGDGAPGRGRCRRRGRRHQPDVGGGHRRRSCA